MKEIFRRVPLRAARLGQRDAKHSVMTERMIQHMAIARLENVKREQRMRKKHRARQRHHRQLLWQSYS